MNIKNRRAFTLAEMMVVLLVLSLVMTAFLPVITKRSKVAGSSGGIWQYMGNNSDVFAQTGATQAAAIGIGSLGTGDSTKLLINTSSADQNSILFKTNNAETGKLIITGGNAGSTYGGFSVGLGEVTLTTAGQGYSTAVGYSAQAGNGNYRNATAVGYTARAIGSAGTAIGTISTADGGATGVATALGYNTNASAQYSTAVGGSSQATGNNSLAVGYNAQAKTGDDLSIGANSVANNGGSTAVGNLSKANNFRSVALGYGATASGNESVAVGSYNDSSVPTTASGTNSTAVGTGAQATKDSTIAIGYSAQAGSYAGNIAIGNGALATKGGSLTVIGNGASAADSGGGGTAIGEGAIAGGWVSTAIGYGVKAKGAGSVAIGVDSSGNFATTSTADEILLGTGKHTVRIPGALYVGNGNAGGNFIPGGGGSNWTTSDKRLKDVKGDFIVGLDKIRLIQPINFTYKKDNKKVPHVGVIAQDLQKIFPEAIINGPDGYLMIRQDDMFYAMINSIKQLDEIVQGIVRDLKSLVGRVQQLESKVLSLMRIEQSNSQKIQSLETRNKALESRISKLEKACKK